MALVNVDRTCLDDPSRLRTLKIFRFLDFVKKFKIPHLSVCWLIYHFKKSYVVISVLNV